MTQSGVFIFREKYPISYEQLQVEDVAPDKTPLLLMNGFGVGSFHQHRLIEELVNAGCHRNVFAMDYLGQGRSWPTDCADGGSESELGLQYSGKTWMDQTIDFIDNIVPGQKVHIVGNSVGGHLATWVALARPELVESVILLNATPVWGLNLPGWSGHLPAPAIPKTIGRYLFDRIRELATIEKYLEAAYANREAFDVELMNDIRSCTEGSGGHAAFTSILWSPPIDLSPKATTFYEALSKLECDVLLVFGREDSWCKPAFARRMLTQLEKRTNGAANRYVELSDVGHCPNHEAPRAVAQLVHLWIEAHNRSECMLPEFTCKEIWGETKAVERRASDIPLSLLDRLAVTFV